VCVTEGRFRPDLYHRLAVVILEIPIHIVDAIEGLAGERVAEQVERLAHHALRGEVLTRGPLVRTRRRASPMLHRSKKGGDHAQTLAHRRS
jgi:hypothetical protein